MVPKRISQPTVPLVYTTSQSLSGNQSEILQTRAGGRVGRRPREGHKRFGIFCLGGTWWTLHSLRNTRGSLILKPLGPVQSPLIQSSRTFERTFRWKVKTSKDSPTDILWKCLRSFLGILLFVPRRVASGQNWNLFKMVFDAQPTGSLPACGKEPTGTHLKGLQAV